MVMQTPEEYRDQRTESLVQVIECVTNRQAEDACRVKDAHVNQPSYKSQKSVVLVLCSGVVKLEVKLSAQSTTERYVKEECEHQGCAHEIRTTTKASPGYKYHHPKPCVQYTLQLRLPPIGAFKLLGCVSILLRL